MESALLRFMFDPIQYRCTQAISGTFVYSTLDKRVKSRFLHQLSAEIFISSFKSAWLLAAVLTRLWLYILFSEPCPCTSSFPICSLYWNVQRGPATAHFHRTGGGDFIDLLQKAGVEPITRASSFPASLAVRKRWFVVLSPMVLYIALKTRCCSSWQWTLAPWT